MSLHETAQTKIHNLIDNGEADKVKWCELLAAFSQLTGGRIETALVKLTPAQLMTIKEGASKALEQSKLNQMRAIQVRLAHEGISNEELIEFLQTAPAPKPIAITHTSKRQMLTREQIDHRDQQIRKLVMSGIETPKRIHEELSTMGIESSYSSVAAVAKKIRDELATNKAQEDKDA